MPKRLMAEVSGVGVNMRTRVQGRGRKRTPRERPEPEPVLEGVFERADDYEDDLDAPPPPVGTPPSEYPPDMLFPAGHRYAGQPKHVATKQNFRWFVEAAARMALDMEQGTWLDPRTGELWPGGRYSRARIGAELGFPRAHEKTPSFLRDPVFPRAVEWERVKREASMRMSADNVKPLVAVATSGLIMELLDRVLNQPRSIADRELLTETRKYVNLLVEWDRGKPQKPHIQQTLQILFQNIQGLPATSRAKVKRLLGNELERGLATLREVSAQIGESESEVS